jgi:PAS domain-containing protein
MTEPTPRDPAEPATPEGDGGPAAAEPGRRAAMLEAALGHMDQGLVVLDRAMRVVFWNRRYLELWGFPTDLVRVGVPLDDLIRFDTLRHGLGRK